MAPGPPCRSSEYSISYAVQQKNEKSKKKKKKQTLNLAVSIVKFKTSYFPPAWTSSQTRCKRPTKMARCTSVEAGSATSGSLPLPSLWPPTGIQDLPVRSPLTLCSVSSKNLGKALALRSIRPFSSLLPTCFTEPSAWLSSPLVASLCHQWLPSGTCEYRKLCFLGLSFVTSWTCQTQI